MKEKKRLTANERKALMHMFAALEGMANLQQLGGRIESIPGCKRLVNSARGMLGKAIENVMGSIPTEQVISIRRQLPGLRYSIAIVNVTGKDARQDGMWLSWEALEALSEAIKDRCLMCQKDTMEQRMCPLAKALDELPCIKADEDARGCRYFGGLY